MTDSELLEKLRADGEACPFCGSDNMVRIDIDGGLNDLSLVWECDSCHAGWVEYYEAKSASVLEVPDKSIVNPVGHERDMQSALAKAEAERMPAPPSRTVTASVVRTEAAPLQEEGHD